MRRLGQYVASAVISLSLVASSTAAVAANESAPASNGWMQLSMLTPSSAAVLDSSAVAAAQPNVPPPGYYDHGPGTPPIPVIIVWLLTIGVFIYIITKGNSSQRPNSPF